MVTPLIAGLGLLGGATALRMGLRSAARSGTQLSPFLRLIAGKDAGNAIGGAASGELSGKWAIGGFRGTMDKSEAANILGLR
jgi:hypothetical protein